MIKIRSMSVLFVTLLVLVACGGGTSKPQLKIAYANWAEGIAVTHLAKIIFEDQGYDVKIQNADIAPIFASLASRKADVFMDSWMPVTHSDYMEQYGNKLEVVGTVYDNARIGLVVPEYVAINSIEELNAHQQHLSKKIVGIDAGAGIMKASERAIEDYGLDYKLMTSSGPAMTASLKKAIDRKEWIVVTGWTPHWMFDRFKLKMLEDPKKIYGEAEVIHILTWKGFREKDPFAVELFANIRLTDKQIGSLMSRIENTPTNEADAVRSWIAEHQELVDSWIPGKE